MMMKITTVGLGVIIALSLFFKGNNYKIEHPTNGKHHGIILIVSENWQCTAFVVSKTTAVTAGHCVKNTKRSVAKRRKRELKLSHALTNAINGALISLRKKILISGWQ